jgi:uncharacterized protein (TIGR02453 family)
MSVNYLSPILAFLTELEHNNRREWFEEHRAAYEAARERFEVFVGEVIDHLRAFEDLGPLSPRDCIMRIYRDVRFSRDKSPYRANMGASIARGGRHSARLPYYLHLAPGGGSFLAGGLYMPMPEQLTRFRDLIVEDPLPFKRIVDDPQFRAYFGEVTGERLKRAPAGYPPDHPEIELLRLKQVLVMHPMRDEELSVDNVIAGFELLKPLNDYLNEHVIA